MGAKRADLFLPFTVLFHSLLRRLIRFPPAPHTGEPGVPIASYGRGLKRA